MSLENLKSIFSNTKKFEAAKPKPTQEPKKIVENKGLPVSPDVQKFGSVDLGAMSSQFAIQKEPQRIDFISNTNAEGFVPNSTDKKNSFYKKGTSDFENIQSFGDTPQKTTLEPNSFFQSDLTTLDIGNPNSFISSDITSFDIPNLDSFIQTDVTINAKDSTKFVQTDVTINAKNPTEFVQTDVTTNTQEPNQFNLSDLTLMGTQDVSAFTISDLTLMQTQEPNKFNLSDLTTLNIGDISLFKISDVTTMNIPETSEFVQSDVTTNTQEPNEFPQSDVTINTQEPNEFVQSDVTVNTQEPNEFVQSDVTVNAQDSTEFVQTDVTVNAQDSTEFVQSDVTVNAQDPTEFAQSDVTVNAQDPTEFAQSDVTVNAQDSTEFVQTDVTVNAQEPNQFNLSDLTTLVDDSIYNIDDGPQEVDFLENTHAVGFTANIGDLQSLYEFTSTNINTSIFRIESEPQEVNLFGDTHATGFTAGLLEGSDSLYVGDTSIFRIESEPQEVNLVDIDNKHAFGFTAGLLEGSDSQFVGIDDTGFTNTGILGLMTDNGVVDFFDDTDATGFTLNQFHKAPTLFVGATESTGGGTYENTGTLGTLGMVDFFNNTGAEGFTDMTDGVSEFKNIGDDNTFTKPDGITFDTHNIPHDVNNITFTNQTSNGLNFIDTDGVHSNGFTVGLTDTSDSQFVGVDETTPSFENTGNYYDSIHTRNPISDSIFGPVDFMSGVTSYYPTLESPIPGFTNDFGVGEESLPGYNAQAGALGISRFFRKDDGSGEIQTGLENIYLGTGTHTMWGGSLTLADQIETGLSFLNKSSIFGDDPSTNDIEETDFALPYATGFTPGLSEIDYLNSQFEGVDEEAGTYTPRTSFQGGYVINTDNIDLSVDIPEDGELFNPAEDLGQFGTSNVGLGLFPSKTVRLQGGQEVEFTHKQFDILYGNDQTVKDAKFTGGAKMSLQNDGSGNHPSQGPGGINFGFSRGNEPYRILENGDTQYGDRIIPIKAMIDDGKRMANFIASDQGLAFMLKENFLSSGFGWPALQEFAGVGNYIAPKFYDPTSLVSGLQVGPVNVRTRRDEGLFGFLASLTNLGIFESIGEGYPGSMGQYFSKYDDPEAKDAENNPGHKHGEVFHKTYVTQNQQKSMKVNNLFGTENVVFNNALYNEYLNGVNTTQKTKDQLTFDPFTVMDTNVVSDDKGTSQKAPTDSAVTTNIINQLEVVEKQEHGMPLYFRDLRDGRIVTFRAYISGLNESLSPNWSEENYLGRSEPVYIYSGGAREIGFSLKLAAQSDIELTAIYEKLNRLTSMTYPEYKGVETRTVKIQDESGVETGETFVLDVGRIGEKQRMKAPMLKFRLGELYGSEGKEVLGFIKSLSYTFPDESPWETIKGKRVPKFVDVELGYQIIHDEVPSLSFAQFQENKEQNAFYGISLVGGAPFRKQADSAT